MARRKFLGLMAKSKKRLTFRKLRAILFVKFPFLIPLVLILLPALNSYPALLDRTVAILEDHVLTYREVERIYLVAKLSQGKRVRLYQNEMSEEEFNSARYYAIGTILVRDYLKRIALRNPVSESIVSGKMAVLKRQLRGEAGFKKFKQFYGLDNAKILDIIREKLTREEFFQKSVVDVDPVSDVEARAYYEKEKDYRFFGKSFDEIKDYIKKYLLNLKVGRRNDEWVREQMKKKRVELIG